jgi:hypothetical protein
MNIVWTWSGKYFGWIDEGGLFASDGRHVGEFRKENIFSENGNYIGELQDGRLLASEMKKLTHSSPGFWPNHQSSQGPTTPPADEPAKQLPDGFEDFAI